MGDLGDVYESVRKEIASLAESLSEEDLARSVPATPAWTIKDVVGHLSANVVQMLAGDFPREFFEAFGSEEGIASLNKWTEDLIAQRRDLPLRAVLEEWENASAQVATMMRTNEWPEGILPFAAHILVADMTAHQQDIYGALGLKRDRQSPQIRIGVATYMGGVGLRLQMNGSPALRFALEDKEVVAGNGEPAATVHGTRFELFRSLTGRRSQDQVRALKWEGDPEPFLPYFFPYGVREEPLTE